MEEGDEAKVLWRNTFHCFFFLKVKRESISQINYPEFELTIDLSIAQWFNLMNPNIT